MKRLALFLLLLLSGCRLLAPKTGALEDVHAAYAKDFEVFVRPPLPQVRAGEAGPVPAESFSETLRLMRAFTVRYGEDSAEAAHLKVLEGMIYLQSGMLNQAKALREPVTQAAPKLISGAGVYTRDALFAKAFPHLIEGYALIQNPPNTPAPMLSAARGIARILDDAKDRLADVEVDSGALHLATSAAIFFVWASELTGPGNKAHYKEARDLIGRHLSESEKAASEGAKTFGTKGRFRYLAWYDFLR